MLGRLELSGCSSSFRSPAAGMMQFYFLGTAQFMQDNGIAPKNVPASMAVAQAMQAGATLAALGWLVQQRCRLQVDVDDRSACWLILYAIYVARSPRWLIVVAGVSWLGVRVLHHRRSDVRGRRARRRTWGLHAGVGRHGPERRGPVPGDPVCRHRDGQVPGGREVPVASGSGSCPGSSCWSACWR